jgi:hypothetical protein
VTAKYVHSGGQLDGSAADSAIQSGMDGNERTSSQNRAKHQAQQHADQPNRQRYLAAQDHAREHIAPLAIGAKQAYNAVGRLEQVDIAWKDAEQHIRLAMGEELQHDLLSGVDRMNTAQIFIEGALDAIHKWLEAALVEQVDRLRRQIDALRKTRLERVGHDEIAEQRHQVKQRHHHAACDRGLVAAKPAPQQLRLRSGVLGLFGGQRAPFQILGRYDLLIVELAVGFEQFLRLFLNINHR